MQPSDAARTGEPHVDPEDLALLALGEQVPVDTDHLARCPVCAGELNTLRSVVAAARGGDVDRADPPPQVWAGIAAATAAATPSPAVTSAPPTPPTSPDSPASSAARAGRWSTWALVAASVVGALTGGAVVAAVGSTGDGDVTREAVAATELEALVDSAGTGDARVVRTDDGLVLRLSAASLPEDDDGFYEVWLLDEQAQRMVPLGILAGAEGDFALPAGLDLGEFPVVDVSVEPLDGDPAHSGNSLLRGSLGT
ncbi:anti-sigma factor [Quadrisphaera sp. GCM10027208]|uniref:anti-sigma factor n=1 Tax=Quadrisphaera sp. GCM10027208 TaxID=3273423 RepID=UPI00361AABA2